MSAFSLVLCLLLPDRSLEKEDLVGSVFAKKNLESGHSDVDILPNFFSLVLEELLYFVLFCAHLVAFAGVGSISVM